MIELESARRRVSPEYDGGMDYSTLKRQPKFAERIGVLLGCFAVLERQIPELFRYVTQTAHSDAHVIIGSLPGTRPRIELIERLLRSRKLEDNQGDLEIANKFCVKLHNALDRRNEYAHATFLSTSLEMLRIGYGSDAKNKTKKESTSLQIALDSIETDIREIERLIWYLSGYLRRNERPPVSYFSNKQSHKSKSVRKR